jgi:hypothetical protein
MEILSLIDQLDDMVQNAKAIPLTDHVRVDKEEIFDILDQMRAALPIALAQARADALGPDGPDVQRLTAAVSAAIKENIPEIARAAAAAGAAGSAPSAPPSPPPGGPF